MREEIENPMVSPMREILPRTVAYCCNCNEPLFDSDVFLDFEGEYLCDDCCLKEYLKVKEIEGWEVFDENIH